MTELVRGESLAKTAKPMTWQGVLDIAIGLARGLAAARRRFLREARGRPDPPLQRRRDPPVGTLDGRPYLVTELVRGESLAKAPKPRTWQGVLDIAIGLATAPPQRGPLRP